MELYHHGIKGQKWGVQNGPPYPLNLSRREYNDLSKRVSKSRKIKSGITKTISKSSTKNNIKKVIKDAKAPLKPTSFLNPLKPWKDIKRSVKLGNNTIKALISGAIWYKSDKQYKQNDYNLTKEILEDYGVESMEDIYAAMNQYEKENNLKVRNYDKYVREEKDE